MICIIVYNESHITAGWSCHSAYQAVSRFMEDHINMVSCGHRKCQTRAGVSRNIIKSFEFVSVTDNKFYNRVMVWMTPKSKPINYTTIWLIINEFLPPFVQMRTFSPAYKLHFASWRIFQYLYHLDSLQSWPVLGNKTRLKFLIPEPDSCWVPTQWLLWCIPTYCFRWVA